MNRQTRSTCAPPSLTLMSDHTSLVLVGMMGAGKTSVGRVLAARLGVPFTDADDEIVRAAGRSIPEIFADFGEDAFRDGERRVIGRLLAGPPRVLATGGGAFMDEQTRRRIREAGALSIWLRADLVILHERTRRRGNRPLLQNGNARDTLERLLREREPVYRLADIIVDAAVEPLDATVERVLAALRARGVVCPAPTGEAAVP